MLSWQTKLIKLINYEAVKRTAGKEGRKEEQLIEKKSKISVNDRIQ